jgi:hypothetical protein
MTWDRNVDSPTIMNDGTEVSRQADKAVCDDSDAQSIDQAIAMKPCDNVADGRQTFLDVHELKFTMTGVPRQFRSAACR